MNTKTTMSKFSYNEGYVDKLLLIQKEYISLKKAGMAMQGSTAVVVENRQQFHNQNY